MPFVFYLRAFIFRDLIYPLFKVYKNNIKLEILYFVVSRFHRERSAGDFKEFRGWRIPKSLRK